MPAPETHSGRGVSADDYQQTVTGVTGGEISVSGPWVDMDPQQRRKAPYPSSSPEQEDDSHEQGRDRTLSAQNDRHERQSANSDADPRRPIHHQGRHSMASGQSMPPGYDGGRRMTAPTLTGSSYPSRTHSRDGPFPRSRAPSVGAGPERPDYHGSRERWSAEQGARSESRPPRTYRPIRASSHSETPPVTQTEMGSTQSPEVEERYSSTRYRRPLLGGPQIVSNNAERDEQALSWTGPFDDVRSSRRRSSLCPVTPKRYRTGNVVVQPEGERPSPSSDPQESEGTSRHSATGPDRLPRNPKKKAVIIQEGSKSASSAKEEDRRHSRGRRRSSRRHDSDSGGSRVHEKDGRRPEGEESRSLMAYMIHGARQIKQYWREEINSKDSRSVQGGSYDKQRRRRRESGQSWSQDRSGPRETDEEAKERLFRKNRRERKDVAMRQVDDHCVGRLNNDIKTTLELSRSGQSGNSKVRELEWGERYGLDEDAVRVSSATARHDFSEEVGAFMKAEIERRYETLRSSTSRQIDPDWYKLTAEGGITELQTSRDEVTMKLTAKMRFGKDIISREGPTIHFSRT